MERSTLQNKAVIKRLQGLLMVRLELYEFREWAADYGVEYEPDLVILKPDGELVFRAG